MPASDLTQFFKTNQANLSRMHNRLAKLETADSVPAAYREYYIASGAVKTGASAPTAALRSVGTLGTVLMTVQQFSKTVQNDVYFEFHIPDDYDNSTPVAFRLMWLPGTAWSAGNYLWKLEYLVMNDSDPYNTGTPSTIQMDVTPTNNINMIETHFTSTITVALEQIVVCHFYRDITDTADDTGDINFFKFRYRTNRRGDAQ